MGAKLTRRTLLGWMAALPFAGNLRAAPTELFGDETERRNLLRLMRIVNTVEARYKASCGRYGSMPEIIQSGLLHKIKTRKGATAAEEAANKSYLGQLNFSRQEVLPGVVLDIHLSADEAAYTAFARSTGQGGAADASASGDAGVIYLGVFAGEGIYPAAYEPMDTASAARYGLRPLDDFLPNGSMLTGLIQAIRGLAFSAVASPSPAYAKCPGNCQTSGQSCCCNIGSKSCPWCCYAACGDCEMFCDIGCT
jgi:hypothetical protein